MAREPFLPLFFGDFLSATAEWSGLERSLYLTLLAYQWSLGSLPADPHKLCENVVHWDWELFSRCWETVSVKFQTIADSKRIDGERHMSVNGGRLQNARLEEHRAKAAKLSETNSSAGKKGAEARWRRENGAPMANAMQTYGERHKNANSSAPMAPSHPILSEDLYINPTAPVPRETNPTAEPIGGVSVLALMNRIKAAYPRGVYRQCDWINVEREIGALLDEGQEPDAMLAGVERYAAQVRARGCERTEFVTAPVRFFSERHFFEEFPLPAAEKRGKGQSAEETERESLRNLRERRATMGLADFRDPNPGETADQYRRAQDAEWNSCQPRDLHGAIAQLAKAKAVA
jgi:uncharacterized protein YdaU (DUF1376 family)